MNFLTFKQGTPSVLRSIVVPVVPRNSSSKEFVSGSDRRLSNISPSSYVCKLLASDFATSVICMKSSALMCEFALLAHGVRLTRDRKLTFVTTSLKPAAATAQLCELFHRCRKSFSYLARAPHDTKKLLASFMSLPSSDTNVNVALAWC